MSAIGLVVSEGGGYEPPPSHGGQRDQKLEALGAWPEWATVRVLRETAALLAEDEG